MMLDVSLFSRAKYSAIAISRNAFELTMQCLMQYVNAILLPCLGTVRIDEMGKELKYSTAFPACIMCNFINPFVCASSCSICSP